MATSVNIAGGDDQFNRYKMPSVMGKVEGRGNGIKTRIVNCYEVAKALHRPPGYVCKFFGCELGAQTKINDEDGVYIVNGSFNQAKLSEILQLFIKMFVLCGNCNLPETDLKLKKNGDIKQVCNACGAETMCDMTHKLCTFISNNPPDGKKKKASSKKSDRRAKKKNAAAAPAAASTVAVDPEPIDHAQMLPMGNDFDFTAEADAAAEAVRVANGASNGLAMMGESEHAGDGDEDGVTWSVDTSKEAQEARMRELGVNISVLERGALEEEEEIALKLRDYIDAGKKASKVIAKAEKLFGEERVVHGILAASVVGESKAEIPKSIEERAVATLGQFGTPMEKDIQMEFLDFLDVYGQDIKVHSVLPHILKTAFDGDILEEEVIFKWHRKSDGRKDVREAVQVIIDWLEMAEEESEDEEENDE